MQILRGKVVKAERTNVQERIKAGMRLECGKNSKEASVMQSRE